MAKKSLLKSLGTAILLGASTLLPARAQAVVTNEITSYQDVVKDANTNSFPSGGRAVYYDCNDVKFNNRTPRNKIVLMYVKKDTNGTSEVIGGFDIEPNSNSTMRGHFNARTLFWKGLQNGEIPTNGLNGGSYWLGGQDFNNNNSVGLYENSNGIVNITWEPGEYIGSNCVQFTGMPAFPSSGTGPVSIASIRITGYEDDDADTVPDYFERAYFPSLTNVNANTIMPNKMTMKGSWITGNNPTDSNDYFRIDSTNNGKNISWNSLEGRLYNVEANTNLLDTSSNYFSGVNGYTNLPGTGSNMNYTVDTSDSNTNFKAYGVGVGLSPDEIIDCN